MSSDLKKEYVRKYKLKDYSSAIPTKVLVEKSVSLGEYCEPVDSRSAKKILEEGYNSDPDYRYAQPQDAVVTNIKQQKPGEESGNVYNLAKVADEDQGATPVKKPSPKPRSTRNKYAAQGDSHQTGKEVEKTQESVLENALRKDHKVKLTTSRDPLKRPGKKVVEIEYEVAKPISAISPDISQVRASNDNHSSIKPTITKLQSPGVSPVKSANVALDGYNLSQAQPTGGADFVYSVSQSFSPPTGGEVTYEEPWDLKMKRLKQEQERKSKDQGKPGGEKSQELKRGNSLFEDAIETLPQNSSEVRPGYIRSVSTTSEVDVFHDALETVQSQKLDASKQFSRDLDASLKVKFSPTNTYEDAWDLKNSLLEIKLRQMQMQASATYEEPWDGSKQQQLLQAKFQEGEKRTEQEQSPRHKSISDICESPLDGESDARTNVTRGKYHSMDESKVKSRGRGCNVGQQINPMIPLANQNWYHGNISRDDAEKMLRVCKDGSYIVRVSSDRKSYSLSIKSPKQYIHVQIEQLITEDGSICYILGKNSKSFHSIPEMIDYYTNHRVPLKGTEHITLLHPVECKWS